MPDNWPDWMVNVVYPIVRWLHLASMTLLIGGALFFEFVIPAAVDDLKYEEQLSVMGWARWVFRKVVWFSVVLVVLSGVAATWWTWSGYPIPFPHKPQWFWAHVILGTISMFFMMALTAKRRPPQQPVRWMRLNVIILLVVVFLASTARHIRLVFENDPQLHSDQNVKPVQTLK